jgi:hypothetical protein
LNLPNPLALAPPCGSVHSSWTVIELMCIALRNGQPLYHSQPASVSYYLPAFNLLCHAQTARQILGEYRAR